MNWRDVRRLWRKTHTPTHIRILIFIIYTSVLANIEALLHKTTLLQGISCQKRAHELNANYGGRQSNSQNRQSRQRVVQRQRCATTSEHSSRTYMHLFVCNVVMRSAFVIFRSRGKLCCILLGVVAYTVVQRLY